MKFVITCGGSGGHINPGLAVARLLRDRGHGVLFIGAPQGMECDLVPREGFAIEVVRVRSLSHSLKPKAVLRNVGAVLKAGVAGHAANKILRRFQPDAVLGTGGYASFPALRAALKRGIPVLIHESNAFPGVTTRLIAKRADAVLVGMEACRAAYPDPEKVYVVGTPVRPEFFSCDRALAREEMRLDTRPAVVSILGSQGAGEMNRLILDMMARNGGAFQHIHAAGPKRYDALVKEAAARGLTFDGASGLRLVDYIHNMACACAAADLIICRGGASTLAELAAAGKAAIIIPSPNVTADHQTANAKILGGAAMVLPEAGLTAETLLAAVKELLEDRVRREKMGARMKAFAVPDSAERIVELLEKRVKP
ncbi:MAG: undecaprenyldiphospho-muramoylpentapeptide beta-N-acetylglucosaminyltransferase [Oscillospiraceae bacterium]|jgi:UDP-N-acetylglucosamine--N-acetylmuramyl-(pentapeptide) pyrophosphoryl-undecaprenol N-acetylglucosamine transferase|nr:undecaprenyldiphospho-muramoylpentapeptide beta-N-acetylglucosaminyltransferase [Oscillospiraceae bacterium]